MRILITERQYNNLFESIDQETIENYIDSKYKCEFHIPTGFTVFYNKRDNNKFNIPQMRDILEERFGESYNEEIYKALLFIKQNAIDSSNRKLHESDDRINNRMRVYMEKNFYLKQTFDDIDKLRIEFNNWCDENNLPQTSADDILFDDDLNLTEDQLTYLENFIERWNHPNKDAWHWFRTKNDKIVSPFMVINELRDRFGDKAIEFYKRYRDWTDVS